MTLDNSLTYLHGALLIIIQESGRNFYPDCPHPEIFGHNLSNTALFHIQLTCDHLNSHPPITTFHLPNLIDVYLCPTWWRILSLWVIFQLHATILNLLYHSKLLVCYMVFSSYTFWSIFCDYNSVFRFFCCLVLIIDSSALITEQSEK